MPHAFNCLLSTPQQQDVFEAVKADRKKDGVKMTDDYRAYLKREADKIRRAAK